MLNGATVAIAEDSIEDPAAIWDDMLDGLIAEVIAEDDPMSDDDAIAVDAPISDGDARAEDDAIEDDGMLAADIAEEEEDCAKAPVVSTSATAVPAMSRRIIEVSMSGARKGRYAVNVAAIEPFRPIKATGRRAQCLPHAGLAKRAA